MPEVVCLGEALIDFIPLESGVSLLDVSGFRKAPGGAPANVAAGLSKLGKPSAFVGKVGDDPFGKFLEKVFSENGVDTSCMLFDKEAKTGLAFVSLTAAGVPEFMFYRNPSADMLIQADELDAEFIKSARAFHFGSITLISEPSKSATEAAIRIAKEAGAIISYDPNLRKPLWPGLEHAKKQMLEAMTYADVVKVSEEELAFLSDRSDLSDGSVRLMTAYPNIKLVAVTRGGDGCFFRTAKGVEGSLPAFKIEVTDTTGAGDGFVAGMLSKLLDTVSGTDEIADLNEEKLVSAFRFASAVAAMTTTKPGAITALPTCTEVDTFLRD